MLAGMCRSMILQKRQSTIGHNSTAMDRSRRRLVRGLAGAFVGVLVVGAAWPLLAADGVDVKTNLTYYTGEGADKYRHRLDLYLPKGRRDMPVMMFVHGGGFTVGIKD